jgi:hypothetical protein
MTVIKQTKHKQEPMNAMLGVRTETVRATRQDTRSDMPQDLTALCNCQHFVGVSKKYQRTAEHVQL